MCFQVLRNKWYMYKSYHSKLIWSQYHDYSFESASVHKYNEIAWKLIFSFQQRHNSFSNFQSKSISSKGKNETNFPMVIDGGGIEFA